MNHGQLTHGRAAATLPKEQGALRMCGRSKVFTALLLAAVPIGGCVSVEAPDKPIVIELNINITQEVVYRLAEDAGNTIEENADIF